MQRGELVEVLDFKGRSLKRIIWDRFGTSVIVCTEEEYEKWERTGLEPTVVGFPIEDVKTVIQVPE